MLNPLISIILPVHNGGAYLAEALESVLSQTYPHFALIVLENASTDETDQILAEYNEPRIQVISSEKFLSIGENWARATSVDLAPYIMFVSHDDRLGSDYLRTIVALIEKHPDASVYTTHFNLIDADGDLLRLSKSIPYIESAEEFLFATQLHQRDSYGTGYVMRSERFLEVGGIPQLPNLMFADDLLVYLVAKGGYKVCDTSVQFDYRYHTESTARITKMNILFDAGKEYLDYLSRTDYMDKPEQHAAALSYVRDILVRRDRSILLSLFTADKYQLEQYESQMAAFRRDARWSGDDDKIVIIFRILLRLPLFLRRPLATSIRGLASLTWQLRNRR